MIPEWIFLARCFVLHIFLLKINILQSLLQNTLLFSWNLPRIRPTFAILQKRDIIFNTAGIAAVSCKTRRQ